MTFSERRQLLRTRFQAIGGIPYRIAPSQRKPRIQEPKPKGWISNDRIPMDSGLTTTCPGWMKEIEIFEERPLVNPQRQSGTQALTKIAAQLPQKLPIVDWEDSTTRQPSRQ